MDIVTAAPACPLRITIRPNSAINGTWFPFLFSLLIPVFALMGGGFALLGAWPVLPWLLAALLALFGALHHIERHAGDFEQISIGGHLLTVDRHAPGADEHLEFNCQWVQVVCHDVSPGATRYLALRSHGREYPFGHNLSDHERAAVFQELRSSLKPWR